MPPTFKGKASIGRQGGLGGDFNSSYRGSVMESLHSLPEDDLSALPSTLLGPENAVLCSLALSSAQGKKDYLEYKSNLRSTVAAGSYANSRLEREQKVCSSPPPLARPSCALRPQTRGARACAQSTPL
jgi:hypothetical protein